MGQAMIAIAVASIVYAAYLFVSAPGFMGVPPTPVWAVALPVLGIIVGLVWMIRIYRADPEPDQHAWRYRAKR